MTDTHSTPSAAPAKPNKPYPDFPLFPHAARQWAKKIRGKTHYFGPWEDPDAALAKYLEQKDALHAGRIPRPAAEAESLTVKDLVNAFLRFKHDRLDSGELKLCTFKSDRDSCALLAQHLSSRRLVSDLGPDDFAALRRSLAKRYGPVRLSNEIQRIRSVFKFAWDKQLIDRPVPFGPEFTRPTRKTMRLHRAGQKANGGLRLYTAEEIRRMLAAANAPLRAMILLAINCGFGNADVGRLPLSAVDLETGRVDYPRPKTGIERRCPLWAETVQAIRESLAKRKEPKNAADAGLVFITKHKQSFDRDTVHSVNGIVSAQTRRLLRRLGINGHRNFYTLRHTFRTIADEAKDQPAADHIMGHEAPGMACVYRERISDERLRTVVEYVRQWLFGKG
jgi:integrase